MLIYELLQTLIRASSICRGGLVFYCLPTVFSILQT